MNLENRKINKTTVWSGVGAALFLVLLMTLMPMSGLVENTKTATDFSEESDLSEAKEDPFALPQEQTEKAGINDQDPAKELLGMRSLKQKAYIGEDGQIEVLTYSDPIHFISEEGTWEDIDTNLVSTANGWEVTDNIFKTYFSTSIENGVAVQAHPNADPVIVGIQPQVVALDVTGTAPMPYRVAPAMEEITTGGNTIRYPLAEGFDLDYKVDGTQVKQNLIIREQPTLDANAAWLGLSEFVRLPVDYALFMGEVEITSEMVMTQESLEVRHIETGELLLVFPEPVVFDINNNEVYGATYFVSANGPMISLTTAVDSDWLMDENRSFPVELDPSVQIAQSGGGYCYIYYGYCYNNSYSYTYRYYSSLYYLPWHKYTFAANNFGSSAYATKVEWKVYRSYHYSYSSNAATTTLLQSCGTDVRYNYGVTTASCSGTIASSLLSGSNSNTNERKLISSIWNSAASGGTIAAGTGWKTATICNSQSACSTGDGSTIFNAANNGGTLGMGMRYTTNTYHYSYTYNSGSSASYFKVTYGGASDTTPPTALDYAAYSGITSYKEGARTFFITLKDNSGIDSTASNGPKLMYSINNGTYTSVGASAIGTCSTTVSTCQFKATTAALSAGDYVTYYWTYQDIASTPNSGTTPSGGSTTPHWFYIDDVANAGTAKKFQVSVTDRSAYSSYSPQKYFDQLMTYYDSSDEFVFEFDTTGCGTGSQSCFYTSSYYFYSQWKMRWTTSPSSGYNGFGGTLSGEMEMHKDDGGYLSITANNGPGMNLIYLYDSTTNNWAMVGLDTSTGIDEPMTGGVTESARSTYGYTKAFNIKLDNIYGTVGKFDFNGSYSSSRANWLCQGTNGFVYFFRSTSSNPGCTSGYYYAYSTSYKWTGFAIGTGYYGSQASTGSVSSKVSKVAPEPDRSSPAMDHTALLDSHALERTISVQIGDQGEPATGLNVSTSAGVGPTLYYRVSGTTTWASKILSPVGQTRSACVLSSCDWSATIGGTGADALTRGDSMEYYITSQDVNSDSAGANSNTSATYSFSVGDPNKMFVVEWHDVGYRNDIYECTYQAVFYDVTNEIEFKYDTNCEAYYDYATVGYQDQSRTKGDTFRAAAGYMAGSNPNSVNYRIATDGSDHGWETFDLGMVDLINYNTAISGSSNGYPYAYYCTSSYYWNQYKAGCDANVDMPDGFNFDYFGTTYNGSDSNSRVMISRFGGMYFKSTTSTAPERAMQSWYANMPDLPYSSSTYSRPGLIAPWWGYYSAYYCYDTSSTDCSVRYRVMPFEGKGTDVTSDITTDTSWDLIDSPIRINPSNDYLSISANLNIEPGVVIQVGNGKGISFDGACDQLTAVGNSTDHILFEGQSGGTWKGVAFTASCTTGTDDRHTFEYVDFANTTDAAIAAGSRHGTAPSTNSNVGNFTMNEVTFTNVGSAVKHGSGDGSVFDISNFAVDTASGSCFNFPADSIVTLYEGSMTNCNTAGGSTDGAVTSVSGTLGSYTIENVSVSGSSVNLFLIDSPVVMLSNVSAGSATSQSGYGIDQNMRTSSTTESFYAYNVDASGYTNYRVNVNDIYNLEDVDLGTGSLTIIRGTSPDAGDTLDNVQAGNILLTRNNPQMTDITATQITINGGSRTTDSVDASNIDLSGQFSIQGCGYTYSIAGLNASILSSSCSSTNAPNTVTVEGGVLNGGGDVIYARNSKITVGEVALTGGQVANVAKVSTNGQVTLVDVTNGGNACATASGWAGSVNCRVSITSSSGSIFFGGLADVAVYKNVNITGVITKVYKPNHVVTADLVDSSGGTVSTIGRHVTDASAHADVWVLNTKLAGTTLVSTSYTNHNVFAWGAAGMNESYDITFGIGDAIELELMPAPIDFDQPNMDCNWLATNATTSAFDPEGDGTYLFDETPMTLSADLNIDGCTITLMGASLRIKSDATNSPTLIISNGGSVVLNTSSTNKIGTIKAVSSSYPMHIDVQSGLLWLDGGVVRDHAQSSTTGAALVIGEGATLKMTNGGAVYGLAASSDEMATVKIDGGSLDGNGGNIFNSGQTGTGIWFENAQTGMSNLGVSGAAVGIQSYNAAPQLNGFTVTSSTVGVDVYGGMSLPLLYRSTSLSGESAGWKTYSMDLGAFLNEDYVQVGYNSVYEGGNAHPRYNYATSKYYMMTDRMWVEFDLDTNGDGVGDTSYNQSARTSATRTSPGYYDGSGGNADYAGYNYYDCNLYGYTQNPAYRDYGYYGYMANSYYNGGKYSSNGNYDYPGYFGYRMESNEMSSSSSLYYPYHYWGYYYTSYHGGQGVNKPPEGYNGMWGSYNICMDYAYSYYTSPGVGFRIAMPIIDMTNTGDGAGGLPTGTIVGASLNLDFFHNRADNYQDRVEIVARSSNDVTNMGNWAREAGTPLLTNGNITGADVGISIGGNFAAANFENIQVTTPTSTGFKMDGSAFTSVNGLTVTGGNYGALVGLTSGGRLDISNAALSNQAVAGMSYLRDVAGDFSGTITGSAGAAIEYGSATKEDHSYDALSLSANTVGMSLAGSGAFEFTNSNFANTEDFNIGGSTVATFVDGVVDETTVSVTGSGLFKRARSLDVTLTADASPVSGSKIMLMDSSGAVTGSATTNATGLASGILYNTALVDSNGASWPSLSGYSAVTAAKVDYTSTKMDFRYKSQAVALSNSTSSTDTIALAASDMVNYRVCYAYSSTSYQMLAGCNSGSSSTKSYDNNGDGTADAWEYGYYGAMPADMSDKTIMVDVPFMYVDSDSGSSTKNTLNGSTLIITGAYTYYNNQRWTSTYPYNSHLYMNDTTVLSLSEYQGEQTGIHIGYWAWSDINPWVTNSTIVGLSSIAAGRENSNWDPDHFVVEDNTLIRGMGGPGEPASSFAYEDMCIVVGGIHNASVSGNTISGCPVSIMVRNMAYTYYFNRNTWGADDSVISNNDFVDSGSLSIWFYFSYGDDIEVSGNTFSGSTAPNYHIYGQSTYTTGLTVDGNTFTSGNNPIYLRGTQNFDVKNNDITGDQNDAHPGIYTLNGYGSIADNTLVDSDGGIMIDGVRSGQSLSVTGNSISTSAGRTAPSAVGIWAEDCGASTLTTGGNDISTVMNAMVVDGCDIDDTGSDLRGTGGAGSTSWSVDIMSSYYDPQNLTINEGDTVRWRAKEYYNNSGTGETHTVTSNDTSTGSPLFESSGTGMNLGSTFSHTFSTAGTYEYHCANHAWMYGTITVSAGSGSSFTAVGLNVVGNNDDISLDGTSVSGFTVAHSQSGGSLDLSGDSALIGATYAVELSNVDVTSDGAFVKANESIGVGLYLANGGSLDLTNLSTKAGYGVYTDGTDFRWNGGNAEGGTALYAIGAAEGSIENVTFAATSRNAGGVTTQIYAGPYTVITSVGNTLDPASLSLDATAVIHEANLLTFDADRNEDYDASTAPTAAADLGMMIKSTDGAKAAYVSPSFRTNFMTADGDMSDWLANPLNPSDDAMPGVMSGDGTNDLLVTWDSQNLYVAVTGEDMASGDLFVYIDSTNGGSTTTADWYGVHNLPFGADHVLWAEDGSDAPNDGDATNTWGLKSYNIATTTFNENSASCTGMSATIGDSTDGDTEFAIPWTCIGSPAGTVRLIGIVQDETALDIQTVHPTQTITGSGTETLTVPIEISLNQGDLGDGSLTDYQLIYRSFVGSNTPSDAKEYDIMTLADAPCAEDWGTIEDVNMSTNVAESMTIERACPFIAAPSFVTVTTTGNNLTGTGYMVGFEDMPMQIIPMTGFGVDVQTSAVDMDWLVTDHPNPAMAPSSLLQYNQWGVKGMTVPVDLDGDGVDDYDMPIGDDHLVNLSVNANQFGYYTVFLTLTDEHGLTDIGILTVVILPINDAPIIWNSGRADGLPVFVSDAAGNENVADEGFGSITIPLGSAANTPGSFVMDQANEQPQVYSWGASVPSSCIAISVAVTNNVLTITENQANELGGECAITLTLSDDGTDAFPIHYIHPLLGVDIYGWTFNDAYPIPVTFRVNPVNDAPEVLPYDHQSGQVITAANGTSVALPWRLIVMEDDVSVDNLTFDLSAMKDDNDHLDSELSWEFESTSTCVWENYFSDITITGDDIAFTLIPDATTTAPPEQIDYLDDGGIHQSRPTGGDYCAIRMFLNDTANAPAHTPNYGYDTATYSQQGDGVILFIQVKNIPEPVPDYYFDVVSGFDFHGVQHIMPGTEIPVSVDIVHEGDEPPYKYDHLIKVEFWSNGHTTGDVVQDIQFLEPPAMGQTLEVFSDDVMIESGTTAVWVRADVMTCVNSVCPAPADVTPSDLIADTPPAHRCDNQPTVAWSCPGEHSATSLRRPFLEDSNFSNNIMYSSNAQAGTLDADDDLPKRVSLIGASAVPSFAPSIVMVSIIGMFVGALAASGRREEEDVEEMEDDESAVSPVIATILMVAITVVLSGVIYVWASDLANTDAKTVPRIGMKVVEHEPDVADGYWTLEVTSAKTELATQAVIIQVTWDGGFYETSLANQTTYGFVVSNVPGDVAAPITVTFADNVDCDDQGENCKSTFGVGDFIVIGSHDSNGDKIQNVDVTVRYSPGIGSASVLQEFRGLV